MLYYNRIASPDGKHSLRIDASEEVILKVIDMIKSSTQELTDIDIRRIIDDYRVIKLAAYPDLKKGVNKKFAQVDIEEEDYFESPTNVTVWKDQLVATERVFNKMTVEEKAKFLFFIVNWNYQINVILDETDTDEVMSDNLRKLCVQIGREVIQLDKSINLWDKIVEYGKTLKIIEDANIGKRDQDTEENTFYVEHSRRVCNIAILSKIFLPLFAAMINVSKKQMEPKQRFIEGVNKPIIVKTRLIDTRVKEIYCVAFIEPLIIEKDDEIYTKFCNYISNFVEKMRRKQNENECTDIFRNNTTIEMSKSIVATEICKKFIKVSLNFECSNIMNIVHTDIGTRVRSFEKGPSAKSKLKNKAIFVRNVSISDEDDSRSDAKSQLDVDSIFGEHLFDIEPVMKATWVNVIEKYTSKYNIDRNDFMEVMQHNNKVIPSLEEYVALFINSIFVDDFGGSYSIFTLNKTEMIGLMTLVQFVAAKRNYCEFAHRISANVKYVNGKPEEYREMPLSAHKMMQQVEELSRPIVMTLLPLKTRAIVEDEKSITLAASFKTVFKNTATYFAITVCYNNTHPIIKRIMDDEAEPGTEVISSVNLLAQYSSLMYDML